MTARRFNFDLDEEGMRTFLTSLDLSLSYCRERLGLFPAGSVEHGDACRHGLNLEALHRLITATLNRQAHTESRRRH